MTSCPAKAMRIEEETGAVIILEEKCLGCGVCAKACPFNMGHSILKFDSRRNIYIKCDLCYKKTIPVCVEVCPTKALKYTDWKPELLVGGDNDARLDGENLKGGSLDRKDRNSEHYRIC
jgi:Fe-S-cluster-containing hydrogenase component 2